MPRQSHFVFRAVKICVMSFFAGILCLISCPLPVSGQSTGPSPAERVLPRIDRALLIGVSEYPHLKGKNLQGAATDVGEWLAFLTKYFQLPADRIRILSEEEGRNDASSLPSRRNIEQAIQEMADATSPGDSVFVFITGHGACLPENPDEPPTEHSGLDSAYIPRDTTGWGEGPKSEIQNAIRDHEMGAWLGKIREKNAFIWYVADTCHSGDGLRSALEAGDTPRLVTSRDLGIPDHVIEESTKRARDYWKTHRRLERFENPADVAFYACLPFEQTVERLLPLEGEQRIKRGLFSYTIRKVLSEALEDGRPITYRELLEGVRREYGHSILRCPTPLAEGQALDYDIATNFPRESLPAIRLTCPEILHAGSIHGITPGTVIAVFDANSPEKIFGHVRVTGVSLFESKTEPCEYGGNPPPEIWPDGISFGKIVFSDYGDFRLRIGFFSEADEAKLADFLKKAEAIETNDATMFVVVEKKEEADFLVQSLADKIQIVPGSPSSRSETSSVFGPFSTDEAGAKTVRQTFRQIAKARNLMRIAEDGMRRIHGIPSTDADKNGEADRLDIRFLRIPDVPEDEAYEYGEEMSGGEEIHLPVSDHVLLNDRDFLLCRIRNDSKVAPYWITVLHIDSSYGITCVNDEEVYLLEPEGVRFCQFQVEKNQDRFPDRLILIGTKTPSDFRFLAQESVPRLKGDIAPSGLGSFLCSAAFGEGKTRGLNDQDGKDAVIRMITLMIGDAR